MNSISLVILLVTFVRWVSCRHTFVMWSSNRPWVNIRVDWCTYWVRLSLSWSGSRLSGLPIITRITLRLIRCRLIRAHESASGRRRLILISVLIRPHLVSILWWIPLILVSALGVIILRVSLNTSSLSIEVLRRRSLVIILSIIIWNVSLRTSAHSWSCVVSSFDGTSDAAHVKIVVLGAWSCRCIHTIILRSAWTWGLSNFHSWGECIFQKDTSILWTSWGTLVRYRISSNSWVRIDVAATWWHRVMISSVRGLDIVKMMSADSFSLWMFLSTSCSWIEEIIHALKSSSSLPWNFTIFSDGVLEYKKMISFQKNLTYMIIIRTLPWIHMLTISVASRLHQPLINRLSLLHLRMSCGLGCDRWSMPSMRISLTSWR